MESILDIYSSEGLDSVGRICFDERPCQLTDDIYSPIPMKGGQVKLVDNEYIRKGTCCLLLAYDIDTGQRYTIVSETRTKADYAKFMDWLEREHYQDKEKIIVIQDNLNTHTKGSFYENLPVQRAGELNRRMDFQFTPKHASWLNMAEIEFSSVSRQCLRRKIATIDEMKEEVFAWQEKRNKASTKISWSFTTDIARGKMANKYPSLI
jgi:transposase